MVATAQETSEKSAATTDLSNPLDVDPLYLRSANGTAKIISKEEFDRINTEQIDYIQILNDPSSVYIYGDKGKNGVVLIVMKGDSFSAKYPGRKRRQR